ncbi:hypothetical protein U202_01417, partial [Staphylococcus aureus H75198]
HNKPTYKILNFSGEWDRNDKEPLMIYYVVVLTH